MFSLLDILPSPTSRRIVQTGIALVVFLGAGVLAGLQPAATEISIAALILAIAALAAQRYFAAAAIASSLILAAVDPMVGVIVLALGLSVSMLVPHAARFRPVALIGIPLTLYLAIGSANISTYRGIVGPSTVRFMLYAVAALLSGIAVLGGSTPQSSPEPPRQLYPGIVALSFLPGVIGLGLVTSTAGVAILHPGRRFETPGIPLTLFELLIPAAVIYAYHALSRRRRFNSVDQLVLGATGVALLLSGYRGWFMITIIAVALITVRLGSYRITPLRITVLLAVLILVFGGIQAIRRSVHSNGLVTAQTAAARYGASNIPPVLRDVHISARESVALTQELIQRRNLFHADLGHSLLTADLLTTLPGHQKSGGDLVAETFGRSGQGGLTPGAVGASYTDLGSLALVFFVILGGVVGLAWRASRVRLTRYPIFALLAVYLLHFMDRGIPKLTYILGPAMVFAVTYLGALPKSRQHQGSWCVEAPEQPANLGDWAPRPKASS